MVLWVKKGRKDVCLLFFRDSQTTNNLAMNQNSYYMRTKHIKMKFHYIRDTIANGNEILKKVHT